VATTTTTVADSRSPTEAAAALEGRTLAARRANIEYGPESSGRNSAVIVLAFALVAGVGASAGAVRWQQLRGDEGW
jgi:hypothetical protein